MNNQSEEEIRNSIIGLGEKSIRKSYYPQLQKKIQEIEELNKNLESKIKERTKEVREQKEIFESLFNDSADAQALIKEGSFIDCNNALLKLLKYEKKEDFLLLRPYQISPTLQADGQISRDKELYYIDKCIKDGHTRFEWIHKKSDGENFWVNVLLTRIVLNKEIHLFVVWRDITEKKKLEEEINRRNNELEESNTELNATVENLKSTQEKLVESAKMASLGGLVAGIANEIHKPIDVCVTAITFLLHTLEDTKEEFQNKSKEELFEYINSTEELSQLINNNLKDTAELINKFKQVAIEHKHEQKRTINIKNYLEGVILGLQNKIDSSKYKIKINCHNDINIDVYPDDFSLIFTHLINNSIEHGFKNIEHGNITIDLSIKNESLKIKFKNDGHPFEIDDLKKIFEPFYTTSSNNKNLGLGLNIIYNIVNKLNGTISCENRKSKGVKIDISIPISIVQDNLNYQI